MTPYEQVADDLAAEHAALEAVLDQLSGAAWERPTHATGWAVRDQVAHLAELDEVAALAIRDPDAFREHARKRREAGQAGEPSFITRGRELSGAQLLAWWRSASAALSTVARESDGAGRLPWYGPDMSSTSFVTARLMECWSHGLDVVDVVDRDRPPTDRIRHVVFLGLRARPYSYTTRGLTPDDTPLYVELAAPSGEIWRFGDPASENRITGPASDFAMVTTRRRHHADTDLKAEGPSAMEFLEITQAFAGPPGDGRRPGQFPKKR